MASNTSGGNCSNYNSTITGSNNLANDDSCGPGFAISSSILLAPLANNGGPTQTKALLPGSAAIDAGGDAACPALDQRGVTRPLGAHCDIGAYEAEPTAADTTPPGITLTTPAEDAVYLLGQTLNADYACQEEDGGSGFASCTGTVANGSPIDIGSIGTKTFTVNAADNAGNTASATHTYQVVYNFTGFFDPVENIPGVNAMKAGAAVPIKFSLAGDQGLNIFADGFPKSQPVSCSALSPLSDPVEITVTAGHSLLSYDPATDQYTYVWKTNKGWAGTCRVLTVQLDDGTQHLAYFQFK